MKGKIYAPYPFHMAYASSLCREDGHDVWFYDALTECDSIAVALMKMENFAPEITFVNISAASEEKDLAIAKSISLMGSKICLVGSHATVYAERLIKLPFISYITLGEYDLAAAKISRGGADGIYPVELVQQLDTLPFPILEGPAAMYYNDTFTFAPFFNPGQIQIWTTRGCRWACSHCVWANTMYDIKGKGRYRQRTAGNVLSEIDYRCSRLPVGNVLFDDDTFSDVMKEVKGDPAYDRLTGICDGMEKRGLQWGAMTRIDTNSLEMWKRFYESGMIGCKIGIESFSVRTLKKIKKGCRINDIADRVCDILDIGVKVYASTMAHIPGETEEDRELTVNTLSQIRSQYGQDKFNFQRQHATPYPGTPLYEQFKAAGFDMDSDLSLYDGGGSRMHALVEAYNKKTNVQGFEDGSERVMENTHIEGIGDLAR